MRNKFADKLFFLCVSFNSELFTENVHRKVAD